MRERRAGLPGWAPAALLALWWAWKGSAIWSHLGTRHYVTWGVLYDAMHMHWMSWWTGVAASSAEHGLFRSALIDFPYGGGTDLDKSLAAVHAMLAGLLRLVAGAPAAHNLVALAGLGAALVAAWLLLRRIAGHGLPAALLAVLAVDYALCWERTLPDLDLVQLGYLGFSLHAWLAWAESGRKRWLLLAVLLGAWTTYTQMYYGLGLLTVLGAASLLSLLGLSPPGVPSGSFPRRTALLLGLVLVVALALHARNIATALAMASPGGADRFAWDWWEAATPPLLALLLALVAIRVGSAGALLWALVAVPLAVLAMGESTVLPGGGTVTLPLHWLKAAVPFLHRLSFCFRFVPSLLLCLAAGAAALVYASPALASRLPAGLRPTAPWLPVLGLWCFATLLPIPRMEPGPLWAPGEAARACTDPLPAACTLTERQAACPDEPSDEAWVAHKEGLGWYAPRAADPLLPLRAQAMPEPPPCVAWLAEQPAGSALLELSTAASSGYSGYLQTFHGQPVTSTPSRSFSGVLEDDTVSDLARWSVAYRNGGILELPDPLWLANEGMRFVVLYGEGSYQLCQENPERPLYNQFFQRPDEAELEGEIGRPGPAAFGRRYGDPVCEDAFMRVYAVAE